jgi:hypothetical protein
MAPQPTLSVRQFAAGDIAQRIGFLRQQRVMLDGDLAALYGVPSKSLNQGVTRNLNRFPSDFMFQLTREETASLRSQTVTLGQGRGKHPILPATSLLVVVREMILAHDIPAAITEVLTGLATNGRATDLTCVPSRR